MKSITARRAVTALFGRVAVDKQGSMQQGTNNEWRWRLPTTANACGGLGLWLAVVLELVILVVVRSADPFFLWCLKVGFPIFAGCFAVLLYSRTEWRSLGECMSASMKSVRALYVSLLVLAILFSPMLLMYIFNIEYLNLVVLSLAAAPFAIILAWLGGWVGYKLQMARWRYIG